MCLLTNDVATDHPHAMRSYTCDIIAILLLIYHSQSAPIPSSNGPYGLFPAITIIVIQLIFPLHQKTVLKAAHSSLSTKIYETPYPTLQSEYNAMSPFRLGFGTPACNANN